jgi:hypothetical protein
MIEDRALRSRGAKPVDLPAQAIEHFGNIAEPRRAAGADEVL